MTRIVFAGCDATPDFTRSDRLLADALEAKGAEVSLASWTGAFAPFAEADGVVVRSTWDYYDRPAEFRAWIGRLASEAGAAINATGLMLWNLEKSYLHDLAERGAPVVPTAFLAPDADSAAVAETASARGWRRWVLKPAVSASAHGLSLGAPGEEAAALAAAAPYRAGGLMLQPVVESVAAFGEASLVFAGDALVHAVRKRPKAGDIRCQEEYGGLTDTFEPPPAAVRAAEAVFAALDPHPRPVYARVDLVRDGRALDSDWRLIELELIEPELFLHHAPEQASWIVAGAVLRAIS
ncbi:MAG: hypothetical protein AAFV51_11610 [Pseudomonadota bacterium]